MAKSDRRFSAKEATVYRDLRNIMTKMGATSLKVDYDLMGDDPAVKIFFDRNGRRYMSQCDTWPHYLDNLRAAQLAIEYTWRIADGYGVSMSDEAQQDLFNRIFAALDVSYDPSVLALNSGNNEWWEVLGVPRGSGRPAIVNAYRALAKVHHPDVGGDAGAFQRIVMAYEQGLKESA